MKRNGKQLATLADGHPRRMSDGKNAVRKMNDEQRAAFVRWMIIDQGLGDVMQATVAERAETERVLVEAAAALSAEMNDPAHVAAMNKTGRKISEAIARCNAEDRPLTPEDLRDDDDIDEMVGAML